MKALVGALNQEKALVGAFSVIVIVQPVVEPMEHYTALVIINISPLLMTRVQPTQDHYLRNGLHFSI